MPAILYGFEACGEISKSEMQAIGKIPIQTLLLHLPVTTTSTNGDRCIVSKGQNWVLNSDANL